MARTSGLALAFTALGCSNEYPLPPTPCDDYCLATQRAGCPEDWPEKCVSSCEFLYAPEAHPECRERFDLAVACFDGASSADFHCVNERSEPREGVCQALWQTLYGCVRPLDLACERLCQGSVEGCAGLAGEDWEDCWVSCRHDVAYCEEPANLYAVCEASRGPGCGASLECAPEHAALVACLAERGS